MKKLIILKDYNKILDKTAPKTNTSDPLPEKVGLIENSDEWLTTREAAAYLKVSEATLRNMCCNGSITYYKLDRRNRFRKDDLQKLLLNSKKGGFNGSQIR